MQYAGGVFKQMKLRSYQALTAIIDAETGKQIGYQRVDC
jgi:hypothetical protein